MMRISIYFRVVLSCVLLSLAYSQASAATPQEFYRHALEIKGIHAFAATCQSAHETGYWTSALWKQARNGAGIKADKKWMGAGKPHMKK
ncbi:glucosaminidase domain-containing protein [Synergistaceae bacterium OttesenSCG-928-I11]|nr:glucosaminidase domain-containing protein [Synergistaceae bacterium OttesenSCG-928-I11]